MASYAHIELGRDIQAIAGYYTPQKEVRLKYRDRDLLYVTGHLVMESSCCGAGNYFYALVPGYVIRWQERVNADGLPVTDVEPVSDPAERDEISRLIREKEYVSRIDFW